MKVTFISQSPKNRSKTIHQIKSNVQEKGGSNPPTPAKLTYQNRVNSEPLKNNSKNEKATLNKQISKLSKHELEKLQKIVKKTLQKKYPSKYQAKYDVPIEERVFTPAQLKKFLNAVRLPVYKMLFLTMSSTGVRVGECVVLKPENIDFKERCLWVWVEKKERPVRVPKYYPKFYGKKLKSYLDVFSNRIKLSGYLFPNRHNTGHVSLKQAGHIFRQTLDKTGLNEYYAISGNRKLRYFTTNSLRKTFASYQYGLEQARMVLNHSNNQVTKRHYYATLKEKKIEMIEQAFSDF